MIRAGAGGLAAAGTGLDAVSPVWVIISLPTQFERLLEMVSERLRDGRLFCRVQSAGHPVDPQLLQHIMGPPPQAQHSVTATVQTGPPPQQQGDQPNTACYNLPANTPVLALEAKPYSPPDPFYRPPPQPPQRKSENNAKQTVPVYGVAVDSLIGEFLGSAFGPSSPGRVFY